MFARVTVVTESWCAVRNFSHRRYFFPSISECHVPVMTVRLLVFTSLLLISGGESGSGSTKRRSPQVSSSSSGGGTPVDFDCPEEFGYYAHPTDCTQYYVCVFGGALLESCTGGLMYSHELQTCDWPRNVGCAPGATASQQVQQVPETRQRQSSPPQRERIIQQQIPKHDLYTEDEQLPAEELDSDRQQRVYRGQPRAIGQVQSDRDGLAPHSNAIPVPGRDKLSVVSYGTQQQYTSLYRLKPTGDVIQDKSDHNFLTNVTRRIKRQAPIRSHQDGRPESYDSSPISWSSFQPRIIHHRRPQLIPSIFPSPQPPPPRPSHSSHSGGLRARPTYHTHRRPNEFKFEPSDAKNGKFASTTTQQTPVEASSRPDYYVYHNQPSFSSPVESKYHIVHSKQHVQSTFRPSFGPPAYVPYQANTDHHTTQQPYEYTTRKPTPTYRTQVTKPPLTYQSSTIRYPVARKPTSYVYSSNSMHKNSGLQLNQESVPSNVKPNDEDVDDSDDDEDSDDEYDEDEDTTNEEKHRSKESRESNEKGHSNESASVSKTSNESFKAKFPNPPPSFYKHSNSASESLEDKNPFANPDFDFNKFLDDLRDHPQSGGPSTTSQLYLEYSPSSSSKESSQVNDYYYPKETTPKYYISVENENSEYSVKDSSYNQGQSYPKSTSYKQDDYRPSKDNHYKPNFSSIESQAVSKESSKNHYTSKQSPANFIEPNTSPEETTSKYYYNTGKQNHVKYSPSESTPNYNVFTSSSELPFYSQSPQYYHHSQSDRGRVKIGGQYKHPSSYTFTTEKPSTDSSGNVEEYIDDFDIGKGKNVTLLGPPRPPKPPFRLQNIDNHAQEDEEEYDDDNEDDSEEYYDDEEEDERDDGEYEDDEEETPANENTSGSKEKPKSEEESKAPSQQSASVEHMTSNTKYTQSIKPAEHTTPNHLIKSTSFSAGKCFTAGGKAKCLDSPSTTTSTSLVRHRPSVVFPNLPNINHYQPIDTSSTSQPSSTKTFRPRMRRPTSPLPPPSTVSSTLTPPTSKFTSSYSTNTSRQTPMLLSPSYPNSSTEPVAVIAKKPRQRQNRNKSELSEDTDMRDKGHTQRALTRLRASVTPAQQQYVEQQTTQQQTTPPRAYNQSRYVPSQYDPPFYSLYDDEVDLYKEIGDYAQYNTQGSNQYRNQPAYKEKKPQIEIVQQEPVRGSTYAKNKYNTQSDIYQTVTPQEYESYSIQTNDDLPYRQPQQTKSSTRGGSRHRGSQSFTISPNDAEPAPQPNRGTPAAPRSRPTLKPSTTVVGKASEYFDIYRYPPRRPDNVYPTPQVDKTAAKCRKDVCLIPDCSCGGKDIPGELTLEETPQIVLLTFDDSVNDLNKGLYEDLFEKGRVNPNGCPISGTFYVSHEWTDYSQVQNLYSTGHEIASHSVSHSFGEQFSQKKWTKEISGQREILSAYGGVKMEDIRGMRAPFLAIGGNKMFKMLYDSNFTYDSSMPVYENRPPSWPYTMDYKIFHDCMIPPCPTKSYPGVWEVPMVMWQDLNGGRCSMGDACSNPPNAEGVYKMLIKNFERHFTTNRAPFGLFYHAAWFTQPHHKEGFIAFLDTINKMPEVWLVTNWQAIQWVRDPTPINRLNNFAPFSCNYQDRPKKCNNPKVCNLWHKSGVRYMRTCQPCPDVYPWTGKSGVRNSRVDNEIINE